MSSQTKIEWCDATWNCVTGCTKISEGCKNCYAEDMARRFWGNQYVTELRDNGDTRVRRFSDVRVHRDRLDIPRHWRKPRRIMVPSMGDLFHRGVSENFIGKVWQTMMDCPQHTFMVLTKRQRRARSLIAKARDNIWIGVSAENQQRWDERIPDLVRIPAARRFVSIEPCLGLMDLHLNGTIPKEWKIGYRHIEDLIDMIIVGGETGSKARRMNPMWARNIRNQCLDAGIPFFFKRMGSGRRTPEDLKVREWVK